jgi:serine/threonine protein kinase
VIAIGGTVGNYVVERKIGEGAMGVVFQAIHPGIGKRVALKVIHPELSTNEEMLSRFFNEARAVTQIGHHNIVDVQDFGQTPDGDSFIVMELLEGRSLAAAMSSLSGAVPLERSLHIARQIADGIEAAHARGIIHRDLKPDNIILISRAGDPDFVKILDFGLAKLTGPSTMSFKTKTGSLLGTPHYMSPEQAEGKKIDHRVDVYGLGCILFQLVTGRVPFPGEGFGEVLVKQLREPPPLPSRLNPLVPPSVEKIILHALAKKPEFRFPTMEAFKNALDNPAKFQRQIESADAINATPSEPMPAPVLPANAPTVQAPQNAIPVAPLRGPLKLPGDAPTLKGAAPEEVAAMARANAPTRIKTAPAAALTGDLDTIPRNRLAGVAIGVAVGLVAAGAIGLVVWLRKPANANVKANANVSANVNAAAGDKPPPDKVAPPPDKVAPPPLPTPAARPRPFRRPQPRPSRRPSLRNRCRPSPPSLRSRSR